MVTMTESAASKIKELGAQEPAGEANVFRIAVTGGGCSGFQYEFGFDRGVKDGDNEIELHGVRVAIDASSLPYLVNSRLDFVHALMGGGFALDNPNVVAACGCGTSFEAKEGVGEGEPMPTPVGGSCG